MCSISSFYSHLIMTFWKRRNVVPCFITFYRRILLSNDLNIPQLSEEEKKSCEGLISSEECSGLLDSFQSNKTLEMMAFQLNSIENFGL